MSAIGAGSEDAGNIKIFRNHSNQELGLTVLLSRMPELVVVGVPRETAFTLGELVRQKLNQNVPVGDAENGNNLAVSTQPSNNLLLCTAPDDQTLTRVFAKEFLGVFEVTKDCDLAQSAEKLVKLFQTGRWFSSLSSKSIYKSSFVDLLSDKFAEEFLVDGAERALMQTAIGEAVSNGIVHGNLNLKSPHMPTINDFNDFYNKISEQLNSPAYGSRHLVAQIWRENADSWISIADEGDGYEPFREKRGDEALLNDQKKLMNKRRTGRGMEIIHSLTKEVRIENLGRRLMMRF